MVSAKRYNFVVDTLDDRDASVAPVEEDDGEYVRVSDYELLLARIGGLELERSDLLRRGEAKWYRFLSAVTSFTQKLPASDAKEGLEKLLWGECTKPPPDTE
jgi:hypothetical protein